MLMNKFKHLVITQLDGNEPRISMAPGASAVCSPCGAPHASLAPELSTRMLQGEASSLSPSERERALAALAVSHLARLDAPVGDDNSPLGELLAAPQDDPLHQLDLDLRLRPLQAALPDDMALLLELQVEKPAVVARHRGVSRQAISQQATKAMMRVRMLG